MKNQYLLYHYIHYIFIIKHNHYGRIITKEIINCLKKTRTIMYNKPQK